MYKRRPVVAATVQQSDNDSHTPQDSGRSKRPQSPKPASTPPPLYSPQPAAPLPAKALRRRSHIQDLVAVLMSVLIGIVLLGSVSQYFTRSWTFDLWRRLNLVYLTPEQLARYNGSDFPNTPIYISCLGHIFDVSAGERFYGKGHGYNVFAGRDATRALITGCFKTGLTSDIRGLNDQQMKSLKEWLDFYLKHNEYVHVGYLIEPTLDPTTPLPIDNCTQALIELKEKIKQEKIANGTWDEEAERLAVEEEKRNLKGETVNTSTTTTTPTTSTNTTTTTIAVDSSEAENKSAQQQHQQQQQ